MNNTPIGTMNTHIETMNNSPILNSILQKFDIGVAEQLLPMLSMTDSINLSYCYPEMAIVIGNYYQRLNKLRCEEWLEFIKSKVVLYTNDSYRLLHVFTINSKIKIEDGVKYPNVILLAMDEYIQQVDDDAYYREESIPFKAMLLYVNSLSTNEFLKIFNDGTLKKLLSKYAIIGNIYKHNQLNEKHLFSCIVQILNKFDRMPIVGYEVIKNYRSRSYKCDRDLTLYVMIHSNIRISTYGWYINFQVNRYLTESADKHDIELFEPICRIHSDFNERYRIAKELGRNKVIPRYIITSILYYYIQTKQMGLFYELFNMQTKSFKYHFSKYTPALPIICMADEIELFLRNDFDWNSDINRQIINHYNPPRIQRYITPTLGSDCTPDEGIKDWMSGFGDIEVDEVNTDTSQLDGILREVDEYQGWIYKFESMK